MKNYYNRAILAMAFVVFSVATEAQVEILDTDGATNNHFVVYYPANFGTTITAGITITFKSNETITGPANITLNTTFINIPIKKLGGVDLVANDIMAGQFVTITYDGAAFLMTSLGGAWSLSGNTGTTPSAAAIGSPVTVGSNFIGTIDAKDFVFATSNTERMRIDAIGNVGIGTLTPLTSLDVNGAYSARISTAPAAAAAVVIPNNVTLFRLSATVGGGGDTPLSLSTPQDGQMLTIMNEDDNAATFASFTIPANNGVGNFVYVSSIPAWKNVSSSTGNTGVKWNGITDPDGDLTLNHNTKSTVFNFANAATQAFTLNATALTTGKLFSLSSTNTATTGNILNVSSNSTGVAVNGFAHFDFTGNHTGNGFQIDDATTTGNVSAFLGNSVTTGSVLNLSGNAITAGSVFSANSSSSALTGTVGLVTLTGNNIGNLGTVFKVSSTGAANSGTVAMISNAGTGLSLRINSDGTDADVTATVVVDDEGKVGIGTIAPATSLTVNGGISSTPSSGVAGATITIPSNVSVYSIANAAGTDANVITVTSPQDGQYLTILNNDGDVATFVGSTIPPTTGIGLFQYINGSWRLISITNLNGEIVKWDNLRIPTGNLSIAHGTKTTSFTFDGITTGNAFDISSSGLTTGKLFSLSSTNTATTGNILNVSSSSTGAAVNGFAHFDFTGNHTGNGFQIDDATTTGNVSTFLGNSITTGNVLNLSGNAITTGSVFSANSSSGVLALTGTLGLVTLTGNSSGNLGTVFKVSSTGAANAGTVAMISNAGTGYSFIVNDETGDSDGSPFAIDASGNVAVGGLPTPTYKLEVNGTFHSTGITESSDIRWKKDVLTIDNALTKVKQLRGVTYNWRIAEFKDKNFTDKNQIGLIAQEVETIIPQAVNTDTEGFKSIEYSKLVALLIEAIKEQENKIEKLENENASLISKSDSEVNELKVELKNLTNRLDAIDGGKKLSEK